MVPRACMRARSVHPRRGLAATMSGSRSGTWSGSVVRVRVRARLGVGARVGVGVKVGVRVGVRAGVRVGLGSGSVVRVRAQSTPVVSELVLSGCSTMQREYLGGK